MNGVRARRPCSQGHSACGRRERSAAHRKGGGGRDDEDEASCRDLPPPEAEEFREFEANRGESPPLEAEEAPADAEDAEVDRSESPPLEAECCAVTSKTSKTAAGPSGGERRALPLPRRRIGCRSLSKRPKKKKKKKKKKNKK